MKNSKGEEEPMGTCDQCGVDIPEVNLVKISPYNNKRYCWSCAEEVRKQLSGTGHTRPVTKPKSKRN